VISGTKTVSPTEERNVHTKQRILASAGLPSLPDVALRLIHVSADPNAGVRDVVSVVRTDPGMATRIVKAVNSPYFGLNAEVSSVEGAVPLLGTSAVVSLALSFTLIDGQQTSQQKTHWSQSLLKAVVAEYIARKKGYLAPRDFFLAGLLADVGVLAMLNTIPEQYIPIFELATETSSVLSQIENDHLGFDHIQIGVELTTRWLLSNTLVTAIRYHHEDFDTIEACHQESFYPLIKTIRFSTCVCDYLTFASKDHIRAELQDCGARFFGLDSEHLDEVLREVRQRADEMSALMSIDTSELPQPSELLAAANARLLDISLRNHKALSQLTDKNNQLEEQIAHDGLTGVHNRLAFDDRYQATVLRCLENNKPAGVIFCDVDNFKALNDTYGHVFGDEVLRRVARVLAISVRETDFVARYGGEEFVVVALECNEPDLAMLAERLRAKIEAEVIHFENQRVTVTVSAGGCVATPAVACQFDGNLTSAMLQLADEAMFRCKRNGRNRVEVAQIKPVCHDAVSSTSPPSARAANV
jgi:diguanylate cyclase (GGDEF)-like protein